jgi:hypothetical protein
MEGPRKARRNSEENSCNTFAVFSCMTPRKDAHKTDEAHAGGFVWPQHGDSTDLATGVERRMEIMYQQPHLVPPMKLTVWDDMPPTPPPSMPARFFEQSRSLASRASERASLSVRRRGTPRPSISSPMPAVVPTNDLPVRRRSFRPLELSIYLPSNRLSDLPEFDAVSFTEVGEIKLPPRALLRTRSAEVVTRPAPSLLVPAKPASMFERRASHMRRDTIASNMSESRPSSSYEALHSHPVSWSTLPGFEPPFDTGSKAANSVTVLSPMLEEFTPPCTSTLIDGLVSDFGRIDQQRASAQPVPFEPPAPSPKVYANSQSEPVELPATPVPRQPQLKVVPQHTASVLQSQRRVSQWLGGRPHSASISTIASNTTTSSFAEHRRKRSQFYMLSAGPSSPPRPLRLIKPMMQHQRTYTVSTMASTVDSVMSDQDDAESMTTAPTATDIQSRTGTIKSVSTAIGLAPMPLRPIVSGIPDLPIDYSKAIIIDEKELEASGTIIKEINGPLRSPIGVAF